MNVDILVGLTLVSVEQDTDRTVTFTISDGRKFVLGHHQDCCESVEIDDVNGEWSDIIGQPVLIAEERTNRDGPNKYGDSFTWTFYTFATNAGFVDMRWHGSSNGYYSESVDFYEITP